MPSRRDSKQLRMSVLYIHTIHNILYTIQYVSIILKGRNTVYISLARVIWQHLSPQNLICTTVQGEFINI